MTYMTPVVAPPFVWREGAGGQMLVSETLAPLATHLFTTRHLQLQGVDETSLSGIFGVAPDALVRVKQVHGRAVLVVRPGDTLVDVPEADAIVSTDASRPVVVRVADCVPILVADRNRRVVAAIHAGWRGTMANIAEATIEAIVACGVPPGDLVAALGPSIGPCCYQVDDRVRDAFVAASHNAARWFTPEDGGKWRLDLWVANRDQLVDAGLSPAAIHTSAQCTAHNPDVYFSYRRDGAGTGRLFAAIQRGASSTA